MNHRKKGRKLGRVKNARQAMLKSMLGSFFLSEKIKTTEAKAKEIKPLVERLITKAKKGVQKENKVAVLRELKKYLPEVAVRKITGEFISKMEKRNSGYVRLIKLGSRKSDGAKMAILEIV